MVLCALKSIDFSNFGSLKSTETDLSSPDFGETEKFQQFRLVEEH